MFPRELKSKLIQVPNSTNYSIVIVTGSELRHKRFAYRIQKEFPQLVIAWFVIDKNMKLRTNEKNVSQQNSRLFTGIKYFVSKVKSLFGLMLSVSPLVLIRHIQNKINHKLFSSRNNSIDELEIFSDEIEKLKYFATINPIKLHPKEINTHKFIKEIKELDPYFFLTLGGPLYKNKLISSIRGFAINQHAGHSPEYKGSNTVQWALYHRRLDHVSSTIHIMDSGADAGPILRRSNVIIHTNDSLNKIFNRVVALGNELMIEVVNDIINKSEVRIFEQPNSFGRTYLFKELSHYHILHIEKDLKSGWLQYAMNQQRKQ